MSKRVYVLNHGPHDYSGAEPYGELVYCTEGTLDRDDLKHMYRELIASLSDSMPEDYLVLTSLASLCGIACGIFGEMHGRLNLLIHQRDGTYKAHHIFL